MKITKPTEMAKKANETKEQGLWDEAVLRQRRTRGRRFSWSPPMADSDSESVNIRPASPNKETRKDEKVTVKTKTRILKKLRSKVGIRDKVTVNRSLVTFCPIGLKNDLIRNNRGSLSKLHQLAPFFHFKISQLSG